MLTVGPDVALGPMHSMDDPIQTHEILVLIVENCSGEVNSWWILSKLGIHLPNIVFYRRKYFLATCTQSYKS